MLQFRLQEPQDLWISDEVPSLPLIHAGLCSIRHPAKPKPRHTEQTIHPRSSSTHCYDAHDISVQPFSSYRTVFTHSSLTSSSRQPLPDDLFQATPSHNSIHPSFTRSNFCRYNSQSPERASVAG